LLDVAVAIVADDFNVCTNTSVTFTATPTNGGVNPVYAWYVNGVVQPGETAATFTYTPSDGDQVYATLTSDETCANPATNPASSNIIDVEVYPIPTTSPIWHD
jgi:hypothetical protein